MKKILLLLFFLAVSYTVSAMQPQPDLDRAIGSLFAIPIPVHVSQESVEEICQFINQYHIGAVLIDRVGTIDQQVALINTIVRLCPHKPLILQDLEWGLTMRLTDGIRFPHALTCGAIQNQELIYRMAQEIGRQAKLLGVDIALQPVFDLNTNPRNPVIGDRSFGQFPERVTQALRAYLSGLESQQVAGCAKHFPNHGPTCEDSHCTLAINPHDTEQLQTVDLYPYKQLIPTGLVRCVMPAHMHVPALDNRPNRSATLSYAIVTELLRKQLGFNGVIIADALRMGALIKYFDTATITLEAFNAGNDILLAPADMIAAIQALKKAVKDGSINGDEVRQRAERINQQLRMFTHVDQKKPIDPATIKQQLETPEAYALKKELYTAAITLVRDRNTIIPLTAPTQTAIITKGNKPENPFVNTLQTQYKGIPTYHIPAQPNGMEINELQAQLRDYNTIIIGVFDINKRDYTRFGLSDDGIDFIRQLSKTKRVILTVFGSPYSLALFADIPTVIMAYEDDPDAQEAAAHAIVGKLTPTGTLPIEIPA